MVGLYRTEIDDDFKTVVVKEKDLEVNCNEMKSANNIVDFLNNSFRLGKLAEEHCYLVCLNIKLRPIAVFEISHGLVSGTFVPSRDIFMKSLMVGATGIVVAHNHPSGDVTPSCDDMKASDLLVQASKIIGVELLDFIVVGRDDYLSFKDENML